MMGNEDDLLKNRIQKMEEETSQVTRKKIDTQDFKRNREVILTGGASH